MASFEQNKKTKKWCVRYRVKVGDQLKQKRLSGFARKIDAQQAYYEIQAKEKAGLKNSAMSLNELFLLYKDFIQHRLKSASIQSAVDVINLHIMPYFSKTRIDKIKETDIAKWQTEIIQKGFAYKYKSKIYTAFTALLNFAVKFYGLPNNVVTRVGNFPNTEPKKEMLYWSEEEFAQFITTVDNLQWKTFFSFLYSTGCRKGEALALNWNDINLNTKMVHISKSINRKGLNGSASYEITTPKNKSSYRDILLPDNLLNLLLQHYKSCQQIDGFSKKSFVFGVDKPYCEQTIRRRLEHYAKIANVKYIRIHDLRHSHASLLINKGQNILIVAQRLGHSDVTQTLNTYAHLMPSAQQEIIGALDIKI